MEEKIIIKMKILMEFIEEKRRLIEGIKINGIKG